MYLYLLLCICCCDNWQEQLKGKRTYSGSWFTMVWESRQPATPSPQTRSRVMSVCCLDPFLRFQSSLSAGNGAAHSEQDLPPQLRQSSQSLQECQRTISQVIVGCVRRTLTITWVDFMLVTFLASFLPLHSLVSLLKTTLTPLIHMILRVMILSSALGALKSNLCMYLEMVQPV